MSANFDINQLSEHLFRHEAGRIVAVLTKIFGTENLDLSEDVVQETFISAMRVWALKGVPDNPQGWLFRVARNKAIDVLRRNKFSKQIDFSDPERILLKSEYTLNLALDKLWREDEIEDDLLRMMFACCHPEISVENQITLMLKTLCGFSTAEIANAFLTSEDTVSKRLYRTKNFFRDKKIKPEFPGNNKLAESIDAVLHTIYLIFNEGYYALHNSEVVRKDLIDQAIYLCKLLADNTNTQLPEVYAAMALMCFHAARLKSRLTAEGDIVLLADQDRSLWDKTLIDAGNNYLNKAAFGKKISTYHVEAAIAYEHCTAPTFKQTNWKNILNYYNLLATINPNPVVTMHRLTAILKVNGPTAVLQEIDTSPHKKDWEKNYLYHCLLGEVYTDLTPAKAKACYETAIEMTTSEKEHTLLRKKMAALHNTH